MSNNLRWEPRNAHRLAQGPDQRKYWVLAPAERHSLALRIAATEAPDSLIPTRFERATLEAHARQVEAEARAAAEQERNAALERVRELEALLAKRS